MIKNMRCEGCGRRRKPSHEKNSAPPGSEQVPGRCVRLAKHPWNRDWMKKRFRELLGQYVGVR